MVAGVEKVEDVEKVEEQAGDQDGWRSSAPPKSIRICSLLARLSFRNYRNEFRLRNSRNGVSVGIPIPAAGGRDTFDMPPVDE
jgi:hypothetical protein